MTILLIALWLLGALAFLARLLVGRVRLRAITARAWAPEDAEWTRLLEEEKSLAGVSSLVRLLVSPAASTPVTWGTRSPIVLVPEDALHWARDHRRIVLRHELAHIARGDSLAQSISAIACVVYWFHPLALIAARRMRTECEHACDDRVLALGTGSGEYASHLLDVARAAREMGSPRLLSLAMARPSQLEGRLRAVLDRSLPRTTPTRRAQVAAVSLPLALAVVGSAFHPVPRVMTQAAEHAAAQDRVIIQNVATAAPIVMRTTPPSRPPGGEVLPTTARTSTLPSTVVAPVATPIVESFVAPAASRRDSSEKVTGDLRQNDVEILLREDLTLPDSAPVQVAMTAGENLVLVNDDTAHPLDLRAAIELVKQVRAKFGRDIPGDSVQIPVSYRAPSTRRSDAEPYGQLLQQLQRAPMEQINGRSAARHFLFYENPDVELAVSDGTLARLLKTNGTGR